MKNIYYICSHFTDLADQHSFCIFFKKYFPNTKHHLILINHHYFTLITTNTFLNSFDHIIRLPACECAFTNRWYYELLPHNIFKRLLNATSFLKAQKTFTFQENSTIIISEMTEATLPVRFLLKKIHNETEHSTIYRAGVCYHRSEKHRTNNTLLWILHNVYTLIGAYPVSVYLYSWMVTERRYYSENKIIDHYLVFSTKWKQHKDYTEIKYPLPHNKSIQSPQYVFFFDNGLGWTNIVTGMTPTDWIKTMNEILQAITKLYTNENVKLLLKTHPAQKEIPPYNLAGFKIFKENMTAETIFTKYNIRAAYSVASFSTRYASIYGIPSYVFFKLFNFPEEMMNRHKRYLLDFSNVSSVEDLKTLKKPHPHTLSSSQPKDLEKLSKLFSNAE